MIDTIIFDMDGVIIDSEPLYIDILRKVYEAYGVDADYKRDHKEAQGTAGKDWYAHIIKKHNLTDVQVEEMAGLETALMEENLKNPAAEKLIFPGIQKVFKRLKQMGFKLGVASSSDKKLIDSVLSLSDLTPYISVSVSGSDPRIKKSKPDPEIFQVTTAELGADPENCLVVEDSEAGLEAAKRLGMRTAAFLSSPHPIALDKADYVFKDYSEFFGKIDLS